MGTYTGQLYCWKPRQYKAKSLNVHTTFDLSESLQIYPREIIRKSYKNLEITMLSIKVKNWKGYKYW